MDGDWSKTFKSESNPCLEELRRKYLSVWKRHEQCFFLAVYAVYDWAQLTWLIKISSGPVIFIKEYRESQFNNNKTISKYDYGPVKRRVSNLFKFEKVFTETE